jgi:hypothetical protein
MGEIGKTIDLGMIASKHGKMLNEYRHAKAEALNKYGKLTPEEEARFKKCFENEYKFEKECRENG